VQNDLQKAVFLIEGDHSFSKSSWRYRMRGWISLIKNPAIPTMIKLSRSDDDPDVLIRKLDAAGGSPSPYELVYRIYVSNSFLLLQNLRRSLWTRDISIISGWCSLSVSECIALIRDEVAHYIIDRFRMTINKEEGRADLQTMKQVLDGTLLLSENHYIERNSIIEAKQIAIVTAAIMKSEHWMKEGAWLNRVTHNNPIFAVRNKCL